LFFGLDVRGQPFCHSGLDPESSLEKSLRGGDTIHIMKQKIICRSFQKQNWLDSRLRGNDKMVLET